MSLAIIIKAPAGIVLAAESRVTITTRLPNNQILNSNFDNANKLLTFSEPYNDIGVVTYGAAAIGSGTAETFIPEFETELIPTGGYKRGDKRTLSVGEFAKKLSDFFLVQWNKEMPPAAQYTGQDMTFNVGGFDDNEPYGTVYSFHIPRNPNPVEQSPKVNNLHQFGITYGGQKEIVDRLVLGIDTRLRDAIIQSGTITPDKLQQFNSLCLQFQLPLPVQFMPLQDCVNLATLFIKTTIETQNLTVGLRGCGGDIDVAIITRTHPLEFIKKKKVVVN